MNSLVEIKPREWLVCLIKCFITKKFILHLGQHYRRVVKSQEPYWKLGKYIFIELKLANKIL